MTSSPQRLRDPFFLEHDGRRLFAIFHPPATRLEAKGGVVFFAPFAEELNRTRRMATLLAESLSAAGFGTLVFDYSCTGDSAGAYGEARWDDWVDDGVAAVEWTAGQLGQPVTLVGLRLGAAIALHSAARCTDRIGRLVLWQPVTSGRTLLTQFLRIRVAGALGSDVTAETTTTLRDRLAAGETIEVGGYDLPAGLATALDGVSLADIAPPPHAGTSWFEVVTGDNGDLMAPSRTVIDSWREAGIAVDAATVSGEPFWSTQEMSTAPSLVDATRAAIAGG